MVKTIPDKTGLRKKIEHYWEANKSRFEDVNDIPETYISPAMCRISRAASKLNLNRGKKLETVKQEAL